MPVVDDNVDQFEVHPIYALAAMLPDRERVDRLIQVLSDASDASFAASDEVVQVLHGEEGRRILDQRGTGHGRLAWLHRLLQQWTYYEEILGLYGEFLTRGEFLTVIPCAPGDRHQVAVAVASNGGHSVYYFGFETVESLG